MRKTLSLRKKFVLAAKYPGTTARLVIDGVRDQLKLHGETASVPNVIVVYVSEMCNLRCPMCLVWKSRSIFGKNLNTYNSFTLDDIKKIVDEVESFKPMFYFIGGEPTLNRDLFKMISYVHKKGMITQITTNGWFLTSFAQQLFDSGLDFVSISLDGPNARIHDKSRGVAGVFNRSTEGIKKLVGIKRQHHALLPNININSVVSPENVDLLEDMIRYAKSLGVDELSFQHLSFFGKPIQKVNDAYAASKKMGNMVMGMPVDGKTPFSDAATKKIADFFKNLPALSKKYQMYVFANPSVDDYGAYYRGVYPSARLSRCYRPWHIATIRGSGDLEVCQGYVVGNIRKNKLMDLWNNDKYRYFRKIINKEHMTPACYRCCFLNYCFQ